MPKFKVTIDGKETVLTYMCRSHGGYQYNTPGNMSTHTFPFKLLNNAGFKINGHIYQVIEKIN